MNDLYPMLIAPRYVERIWGGHALADILGKPAPRDKEIGEAWEVYDENAVTNGTYAGRTIAELRGLLGRDLMGRLDTGAPFPLLTKLIDAREALSVQVHPDDRFARQLEGQANGKTECWYIVAAEPGAELTYGLARDSSPEEYARLVAEGTLDRALRQLPVQAGDVVYIRAGEVHAIGAGILLYELQQTSDVTYRIYDWNRKDAHGKPRELHVDKARQVLDYHSAARGTVRPLTGMGPGRTMLIAGEYFCEELIEADGQTNHATGDSPVVICALDAPLAVTAGPDETPVTLDRYSSLLVPAAAGTYTLHSGSAATTPARALVAYVPESRDALRTDLIGRGIPATDVDAFLSQFGPAADLGQPASPSAR